MIYLIKISLIIIFVPFSLTAKELTITIDDAPSELKLFLTGKEKTQMIINHLKLNKIKAVFYIITENLNKNEEMFSRVKAYDSAGHFIAHHTNSHLDYNKVTFEKYTEDFLDAIPILKKFNNYKKWFRYPLLNHGKTLEDVQKMRHFLEKQGFKNGYVTIKTNDGTIAYVISKAIKGKIKIDKSKICQSYTKMIIKDIDFFQKWSFKLFNRNIKHSLLLHENDLSALCLSSLIAEIKNSGWKIVSPLNAMNDLIYKSKPNTTFSRNGIISAIHNSKYSENIYGPWDSYDSTEFEKKIFLQLNKDKVLLQKN